MTEQNENNTNHIFPISRESLYDKVWQQPMTELAKELGVSSSYLARVCTRLNVPRPERGYWAKLASGKAVYRPALPEAGPEDELEWAKGDFQSERKHATPQPPAKIKKNPKLASSQTSTHRLIRDAKSLFLKGRRTDNGYLKPHKKLLVDLVVSVDMLDTTLKTANQLFLALEEYDYRITIAHHHEHFHRHAVEERKSAPKLYNYNNQWSPLRPTIAYVGTVAIGLTIFEFSEEVEVKYINGEYIPVKNLSPRQLTRHSNSYSWTTTKDLPSGTLCLQAFSPYSGTDWTKQWTLPEAKTLPTFSARLAKELKESSEHICILIKEAEERAEQDRIRWEELSEKWRREREERERAKAFEDSKSDLNKLIEEWSEARRIEGFFQEIEEFSKTLPQEDKRQIMERLQLAREFANTPNALDMLRAWKTPEERLGKTETSF